ncbi:universal stress protein [Thermomonospora catenispora]|uniref:universal stress protein n=1 Tax=Thermomonospora catenispora TaxID=2493090 RepID=UPI00111CD996|nr:universal stress protein [Thermomonospora catenispora]TNY35371.1 universal stress protein [Thermomonospora catenispora]
MEGCSRVVVGYDGTPESESAVRWAAREAKARRVPLTVCHAWRWPYPAGFVDEEGRAIVRRMGRHVLSRGARIAEEHAPGVPVRELLLDGPAATALLRESDDAMIVIGSREERELPVGSLVLQLPARSRGPVVVVRNEGAGEGRVVAGVDGSDGSDAVLGFAFQEAALREWQVHVVYGCWAPSGAPYGDIAAFADKAGLERACEARLRRAVDPWTGRYPRVSVRTSVVMDEPRRSLLEAARRADLLVVGDRGVRGLRLQALGTTTVSMLQLAPCTVAVVHVARPR